MKYYLILFLFLTLQPFLFSQDIDLSNEPSSIYPYGKIHPNAPDETLAFEQMIGFCDCKSLRRNQDGTWKDTLDMVWRFKYIMNGMAIQDEVWRENNLYAGSIRQYQSDSSRWVVSYFSYPSIPSKPGVWWGNEIGNEIVLKQEQKAPNGMDGFSKLTFYDISEYGFKWKGEWISTDEKIIYPFWKISCIKRMETMDEKEKISTSITTLFDGMREGDSKKLESVFSEKMTMHTVYKTPKGESKVVESKADEFVKSIGTPRKEIYDERISNLNIQIDGNLAHAWMDYEFYVDDKFIHCGTNSMHLVKEDGAWKIFQIIDTRKKEDCKKK